MKRSLGIASVLFVVSLLLVVAAAVPAGGQCQLGVPAIKIGVEGAASGPHADYGGQIGMGATMAVEGSNHAGGVLGRPLEEKVQDDGNKAAPRGKRRPRPGPGRGG